MKKFLKKNKKIITIVSIALLVLIAFLLIYKIFFGSSGSDRYEGIKSHKLSKTEINDVTKVIKGLNNVKSSKVYVDSKIIKIFVKLKDDVEFDAVKDVATKTISKIDKNNLKFYDLEFFVESKDDSKTYPKIGYKHKSSENFVW